MIRIRSYFVQFSFIALCAFIFVGCTSFSDLLDADNTSPSLTSVCVRDMCYMSEVANTEALRTRGLMHRQSLDSDAGMLFVFDRVGEYSFWMKNTFIPLDMLWIDASQTVVEVYEDVQPCKTSVCDSYGGNAPSLYVLEINAGEVARNNFSVGDFVDFKLNNESTKNN